MAHCHLRGLFGCHWGSEQVPGREGRICAHPMQGWRVPPGVSPTPSILGLMPAIFLSVSETLQGIFSRPHPKRRSLIYYIIVEKEFGGKLEYFNRWFHHHSSWTRARHLCLEHAKWLNTGSISQALGTPGQARPAAFPPYSSRVTSVSGNFKSTTGRMNKYLVTSLIMWIATELILLCKKTKTLCRYFSYKLM